MPAELNAQWDEYLARFKEHAKHVFVPLTEKDLAPDLTEDKKPEDVQKLLDEKNNELKADLQRRNDHLFQKAESKLQQAKEQYVHWLLEGKRKETRQIRSGAVELEKSTSDRVKDYRKKLQDIHDSQEKFMHLGQDVEKEKFRAAKAELAKMRSDLQAEVNERNETMKKALEEALFQEKDIDQWTAPPARPIERIDWITRYGLAAVGVCLLLGLLTRTACLAGAAFLLMVYFTMPPLPWLPDNPRVEGHYLF